MIRRTGIRLDRLLAIAGVAFALCGAAIGWQHGAGGGSHTPIVVEHEVDNRAEPLRFTLSNEDGKLRVSPQNRVVEWDGLDGRKYRATVLGIRTR